VKYSSRIWCRSQRQGRQAVAAALIQTHHHPLLAGRTGNGNEEEGLRAAVRVIAGSGVSATEKSESEAAVAKPTANLAKVPPKGVLPDGARIVRSILDGSHEVLA
jgi:hypothetical protein